MGIKLLFLIIALFSACLNARPISYSGGSTLMLFSHNMKNSLYLHLSPSYRYSIGIEYLNDKFQNKEHSYFRFTRLINRKNSDASQRNLYFNSGISSDGLDEHFYGLQGDWETRRLFLGFHYTEYKTERKKYSDQQYQIGLAPYLGDYGDLHSWLFLKTKKKSFNKHWSIMPMIKFFYGDFLIELAYGSRQQWDTQLIYRF